MLMFSLLAVLAAAESWVNLGDRSKWRELVTLIDTGEGSSHWITHQPTVPNTLTHTHTKPHYKYSSHPQNVHTTLRSKSHWSPSRNFIQLNVVVLPFANYKYKIRFPKWP